MAGSVIVGYARTPIGKLAGALASFTGPDLGAVAIKGALERAGISGDQVDYVLMGEVLQAGVGQIPARQAAVKAGIPMTVTANTVNKVCLSGIDVLYLADQMIRSGDADIVVAGGMESMTNAPFLLPGARAGYRMGNQQVVDAMINDGLWCAFDAVHMGAGTERYVGEVDAISRRAQDECAAKSHERAAKAIKDGLFAGEIVAVEVPQRKGDPIVFDTDEGVRGDTSVDTLAKLRPAFTQDGSITAGNASQISDGAAAVVMMSATRAAELGLTPKAEYLGGGWVAGPDTSLLTQPSRAVKDALARRDVGLHDVNLFEFNEAFAAVGLASMADLGLSDDVVNVNGGAISLGHPIGMSGTRLVMTLVEELTRRGGGIGAAALCGGGGQGEAALVRV